MRTKLGCQSKYYVGVLVLPKAAPSTIRHTRPDQLFTPTAQTSPSLVPFAFTTLTQTNFPHTHHINQLIIRVKINMIPSLFNILLSLAIVSMVMATQLAANLTSAIATVTVTESVCINGCAGDATPLSMANALATAANATAAASLIANMMRDDHFGDVAVPQPAADTTTVTTVASATDCPIPPTFDLNLFLTALDSELDSTTKNINANNTETPDGRWSQGRNSLCFTSSSIVHAGAYAIYLDGWGRDGDRCGGGALDNLRGQCGLVDRWGCKEWGTGVLLTFQLPGPWRVKCALDAMWLASPKDKRENGLCCVYVGPKVVELNTC